MKERAAFEVEAVVEISGQGYVVFARQIREEDFRLDHNSTLGGAPISGVDMPRALDTNGNQRFDLWGFWLTNDDDASRFQTGQVVHLDSSQ